MFKEDISDGCLVHASDYIKNMLNFVLVPKLSGLASTRNLVYNKQWVSYGKSQLPGESLVFL